MKTSSYSAGKVGKLFEKFFDKPSIDRLSKSSKFVLRKGSKITPFAFVTGFIRSCFGPCSTYSSWASAVGAVIGQEVSKQALFNRMNDRTEAFAFNLFVHALTSRLKVYKNNRLYSLFGRILLGDSTTLSLPGNLVKDFPGNFSHGEQKAVARLQCLINIKSMQWLDLSLKAFTNNDQSASPEVLALLKKGDLLIRDMGYMVLSVLNGIIDKRAFFISRLRYGINLFDEAGNKITWKDVCSQKGIIDRNVLLGKKEKIPVRIIMIPLPEKVAAERTRKARSDRDQRLNHSTDFYQWIKYNVFITNVTTEKLSAKEIGEVYKVRWQIEILFKSWKSGGQMQKILNEKCTNIYRVKTTIYLMLMFFCMVMKNVYVKHYRSIEKAYKKSLSIIKLLTYVCNNLVIVIEATPGKLKKKLYKHCCYEQRHDRTNMVQFVNSI